MNPIRDASTPDLVASIRIALAWIEELEQEGADADAIEEGVELMRPAFAKHVRRLGIN